MKFIINDDPISYDELYSAIGSYMRENHGKRPSYILVHPETERNIILQIPKESSLSFEVIQIQKKKEELKEVRTICGVDLVRSYDVERGFIIVCG
jgi:hypothetical protein